MKSKVPLLGRYELLERIGLGGMAEVYKARLPSARGLHKTVAIKRILPYHCSDQNFVKMFIDEAKIALALDHPNIGQIYDLCEEEDCIFLAMEYIDGPNLSNIIKRLRRTQHRLPLALTLLILKQVCGALYGAHTQLDPEGQPMQIIHRDVSPHNVMISRIGGVKLIDFGIAKAKDRLVQTAAGTVRGKLLYMSPEHAASRPIDHRTDIFSVGMMLLTLLHGQHIWRGLDEVQVLLRIRNWEVPSLEKMRPDLDEGVSRSLQKIVNLAVAYEPTQRYEDCEQMRADLARLQAELDAGIGGVALGSFIHDIKNGVLTKAERANFVPGRQSIHIVDDGSDPTQQTKTPSHPDISMMTDATENLLLSGTDTIGQNLSTSSADRGVGTAEPIKVPELAMAGEAQRAPGLPTNPMTEDTSETYIPPAVQTKQDAVIIGGLAPRAAKPLLASPLLWSGIITALAFGVILSALAVQFALNQNSPESSAEAQVSTGLLFVQSNPDGALIFVDDLPMGQTPNKLEIPTGRHRLTLKLDGHKEHQEDIEAVSGREIAVSIDLPRTPTNGISAPRVEVVKNAEEEQVKAPTLVLISTPPATVFIDGDMLSEPVPNKEPGMEITPLEMGRSYSIRLYKRGYEAWEEQVVIDRQRVARKVTLKRKTHGRLTVNSHPWAEVYIDGRKVASSTPLTFFPVKVGSHRVTLKNPERNLTRTLQVEIKPGEQRNVSVRF